MNKTKIGLILGITSTITTLTTITPAHAFTWTVNATSTNPNTTITGTFTINDESLGSGAMVTASNISLNGVIYDNTADIINIGGVGSIDSISWDYLVPNVPNGCTTAPCSLSLLFDTPLTFAGGGGLVSLASGSSFNQNGNLSSNGGTTFGNARVVPFEFNQTVPVLTAVGIMGFGYWKRKQK